jgi:hypothetical protein
VHGKLAAVIVREGMERHAELLKVAHAVDALGLEFGFAERGQQQRGENGDDGDDEKQFDQRESPALSVLPKSFHAMSCLSRNNASVI